MHTRSTIVFRITLCSVIIQTRAVFCLFGFSLKSSRLCFNKSIYDLHAAVNEMMMFCINCLNS
jgi:hypothetical protein